MDGHPCPEQTHCKLWETSPLGGEDEALTGCRGGVTNQDAHPQLQHALCLLQCRASAPNLITRLIQWLPPSVSPPKVHSSSRQCHFTPSVHHLFSLLEAVLLSPPIAPCPLPGLAASLLLGLPGMGFGPPKSESAPGLSCCARSVSCSHTGTSLGDGSGALSASCMASTVKLAWPPLLLLDLPLYLVSGLALGWFAASWLHPLAELGLPWRWLHTHPVDTVLRQAGWQATLTHGLMYSASMARVWMEASAVPFIRTFCK